MNLIRRTLAIVVLAGACLALGATQASAANCNPPTYRSGQGYFTSLKVTRTSCSTGSRVARAHYSCRTKNGKSGRCSRRVLNFRCSESRPSSQRTADEYNARVTCRRGSRRVVFTYQQNL